MPDLSGNLTGLRESTLNKLRGLYDIPVGTDEFLPYELADQMAALTALIKREVAVYIARNGQILDVALGNIDNVALRDFGQRRSMQRLSRVRCIHTHPGGGDILSDVDMSAILTLRLDAMCALGVNDSGVITGATVAFLAPDAAGNLTTGPVQRLGDGSFTDPQIMQVIAQNDFQGAEPEQDTQESREKVYLISVDSQKSLDELNALADSAGAVVVGQTLQAKTRPDHATYIGSGKAEQVAREIQASGANLLIVDDELTGVQMRRLEEIAGVPVVDRTTLILDIFAQRATTSEGKMQVSLAQLNYQASHLIGARSSLSRLAGGIGTRGPGESKLEMDRRYIRRRIQKLKEELSELERQRTVRRKNRQKSDMPAVALVGYTNTGKSSLLNRVANEDVLVMNQLFATLDTVSRKVTLPEGDEFLLVDSVGFISKLPTDLVEAFRSTLDEALSADVLVIVSDASNEDASLQRKVVEEVLMDLDACDQPRIEVYNKWDIADKVKNSVPPGALKVSAVTGEGIEELQAAIAAHLRARERTYSLFVPFSQYQTLNELRKLGRILNEQHESEGTQVLIRLNPASAGRVKAQYSQLFERAVP